MKTATCWTPCLFKTSAAVFAVAPVVITSSIRRTEAGRDGDFFETVSDPKGLTSLAVRGSELCFEMRRVRLTSGRSGFLVRPETRCARHDEAG